jgi:hypothetical protein
VVGGSGVVVGLRVTVTTVVTADGDDGSVVLDPDDPQAVSEPSAIAAMATAVTRTFMRLLGVGRLYAGTVAPGPQVVTGSHDIDVRFA